MQLELAKLKKMRIIQSEGERKIDCMGYGKSLNREMIRERITKQLRNFSCNSKLSNLYSLHVTEASYNKESIMNKFLFIRIQSLIVSIKDERLAYCSQDIWLTKSK